MAWEVAAELSPAAVKALVGAATGPEGRVVRQLPAASERLVCRTLKANRKILSHVRALGLRQVRRIRRKHGLEGEAPKAGVRRRGRTTSTHVGEATRPNQVWACYMAPAIKQEDVARVLFEAMIREEARPENIRSANGSEFMAANGIKAIYIEPGCPWQNGVIESFNSCFRREFADRWWFHNYDDIAVAMGD